VRLNAVLAGTDDGGYRGAVPIGIGQRLTLALRDDVGRSGVDGARELGESRVDPGVDDGNGLPRALDPLA
jgi:hypothetical protein